MGIFLRVYRLCYKFGTALRQFLNNLIKIFFPGVEHKSGSKRTSSGIDSTKCAILLMIESVVNKNNFKIKLII
jgi:hypothetical protein